MAWLIEDYTKRYDAVGPTSEHLTRVSDDDVTLGYILKAKDGSLTCQMPGGVPFAVSSQAHALDELAERYGYVRP